MPDFTRFDVSQDPLEALHLSPGMLELMDGLHKTWSSEMKQSDIETKPSSLYTHSSLEELRRFVKNRQIPFKYTHAQSYTRKSHAKKEKAERRKLEAAPYKADAAATFRFYDLPLELREHVYDHFLIVVTNLESLSQVELHKRLQSISPQFREEAGSLFERGAYQTLPELLGMSSFHFRGILRATTLRLTTK
jgi:hypothetical protein